jgi:hypothetical protein
MNVADSSRMRILQNNAHIAHTPLMNLRDLLNTRSVSDEVGEIENTIRAHVAK